MIELKEISLTYCHRCKKPAKCGEIEVSEWDHKMHICTSCLMEFVQKIDIYTDKERIKVASEE